MDDMQAWGSQVWQSATCRCMAGQGIQDWQGVDLRAHPTQHDEPREATLSRQGSGIQGEDVHMCRTYNCEQGRVGRGKSVGRK